MVQDAPKPLRMLFLGGTRFIGPHLVRSAIARGHQVAIFNRGQTEANLPDDVEHLIGDRNDDLESIRNRDWDAVIDLATYGPAWVRSLGEALKGRVKHYTFIATMMVYEHSRAGDMASEDDPVPEYKGSADPYSLTVPDQHYGAMKVLCEQESERQFPGKALSLRVGHIVGPTDWENSFTYWPIRMEKGGEVLAAGDPTTPIQVIDVRDLAESTIRMIENGATGIRNMTGPVEPHSLGQMVDAARAAAGSVSKVTWVPVEWLLAQEENEIWGRIVFWSYEPGGFAGWMRMNLERATADGLMTRPLIETMKDTIDWFHAEPAANQAELLVRRKKSESGTGFEKTILSWPDYLDREKAMLAAWHAREEQLVE